MEPISLSQGRFRSPILRLQSDERLARIAAAGDDRAFEMLVRRHRPTLRRACGRVLAGPQAEDAAQQALLNAHRALRRNGAPDLFEPWLYRIGFNAALKELQAAPDDSPPGRGGDRGSRAAGGPSRAPRAPAGDSSARSGHCPSISAEPSCSARWRAAATTEIARDLGLSRGAVRQLIHRARNSVRSAVTALTPYGLLLRVASDSEGSNSEPSSWSPAAAACAYVAKTLVAALIAGRHRQRRRARRRQDGAPGRRGRRAALGQLRSRVEATVTILAGRRLSATAPSARPQASKRQREDKSENEDSSGPGSG